MKKIKSLNTSISRMTRNLAGAATLALATSAQAVVVNPTTVDLEKSEVKWEAHKVTGKHHGIVKLKSADLRVENRALVSGNFVLDMTSIRVDDLTGDMKEKLTKHLKSEDFFSVEKFPTAEFKINSVKELKNVKPGNPTHEIAGNLTIKGITYPLTMPTTVTVNGNQASAVARATVDRTKYDIKFRSGRFFPNLGDKMISDDFFIDLHMVSSI